jgi:hypothetical protein
MPQDVANGGIAIPFSGQRVPVQDPLPDVPWPQEPPEPRWCVACGAFHRPATCTED